MNLRSDSLAVRDAFERGSGAGRPDTGALALNEVRLGPKEGFAYLGLVTLFQSLGRPLSPEEAHEVVRKHSEANPAVMLNRMVKAGAVIQDESRANHLVRVPVTDGVRVVVRNKQIWPAARAAAAPADGPVPEGVRLSLPEAELYLLLRTAAVAFGRRTLSEQEIADVIKNFPTKVHAASVLLRLTEKGMLAIAGPRSRFGYPRSVRDQAINTQRGHGVETIAVAQMPTLPEETQSVGPSVDDAASPQLRALRALLDYVGRAGPNVEQLTFLFSERCGLSEEKAKAMVARLRKAKAFTKKGKHDFVLKLSRIRSMVRELEQAEALRAGRTSRPAPASAAPTPAQAPRAAPARTLVPLVAGTAAGGTTATRISMTLTQLDERRAALENEKRTLLERVGTIDTEVSGIDERKPKLVALFAEAQAIEERATALLSD